MYTILCLVTRSISFDPKIARHALVTLLYYVFVSPNKCLKRIILEKRIDKAYMERAPANATVDPVTVLLTSISAVCLYYFYLHK